MFHDRFKEVAKEYADSPAIVWRGNTVSYGELDRQSSEIAERLSASGVGKGDIVPVLIERGAEWLAYVIGVMKAGAAYAPISPSTPPERLEFILNDAKTKINSGDPFAVYYTSGSTGTPKGVVLSHSGALAFGKANSELCGLAPGTKHGVQADVGFDSFYLSMIPALYTGGTLYLMDDTERSSLVSIHKFLIKNSIDITFLTSQLAVLYMRSFENKQLTTLLTGSEALREYTPRSYTVINLYGPVEAAVYVTAHKLVPGDSGNIPIGKPAGENRIYIIDGELCVSGPQLAIGYLGRPEETAKKFIPNPYYDPNTDSPCYSRLYRTGDVAEWNENGELLYGGRIDNMVKISGYRIEPGEIEIALLKHPGLSAARVVAKRKEDGEAYLSAYCVPHSDDITPGALKEFLSRSLPMYMLPRSFTFLDALPSDKRTGKVDVQALKNREDE